MALNQIDGGHFSAIAASSNTLIKRHTKTVTARSVPCVDPG